MSRFAAIMTVLGILVFLAAGSVRAEAHPLRVRPSAARRQRAARFERAQLRGGVRRVYARETRVRRRSAKRESARRESARREVARRKSAKREVARREVARRRPARGSAARLERTIARADAVPAAAAYASGVSHPDENVSLTDAKETSQKPLSARTAVTAQVEAAPMESSQAILYRTPPSDIAGAPLEPSAAGSERATSERRTSGRRTSGRVARAEEVAERSRTELRSANRREITDELEQPVVLPGLYRNGRLVVTRPLKGTREILVHQNVMADDEGLNRIRDDDDLRRMRSAGLLVDLPESASLHLNPELEGDRRCARPWTVHFASDISRAFYERFHEPLQVNSAVRTVSYQLRLRRVNGNAAGIDGDVASPHLTGQALDFGKRGMSTQEIAWMRLYLLPLMQTGKLDVEEEFQQACFHISVYRTYSPASRRRSFPRGEVAQLGEPGVSKTSTSVDLDR